MSPAIRPLYYDTLRQLLVPRAADSHKGRFGHVLVAGGGAGFGGAVLLAGQAAARCGAGLTTVVTHPAHVAAGIAQRPELMVCGTDHPDVINAAGGRATVLVAGPGLGQDDWARHLLGTVLHLAARRELPLVLDADGLNLLAAGAMLESSSQYSKWILTPHPGEAARLLQCSATDIQADRDAAVRKLQSRFGGVAILKGAGTLVCYDQHGRQQVETCMHGNPGMATGGMGDILSGIIGGLLAQGLSLEDAARLGVCLHSKAADLEAEAHGERGLLASDLLPWLRTLLNP
jgi:hydroxyethylthiazole kinase-like uncharacterized protein yjeF